MLMIRPLQPEEIGFGKVLRKLNVEGRSRMNGEIIDGDEIRSWRNLRGLQETGQIACYPKHVTVTHKERPDEALRNPAVSAPSNVSSDTKRMVISKGFGAYDVIEGRMLANGVTKQEAHTIAGIPLEAEPPPRVRGRPRGRPPSSRPNAPKLRSHATAEPPAMPAGVGPKEDNGPID
jgi:hypothetical protein